MQKRLFFIYICLNRCYFSLMRIILQDVILYDKE